MPNPNITYRSTLGRPSTAAARGEPGSCDWELNHASTEFAIRQLRMTELGEESSGDAISILPDPVGIILDALGGLTGVVTDEMENKDIGWGVAIQIYFLLWASVWYYAHTRFGTEMPSMAKSMR